MKMETENDKNRVGIYTQVSTEATAVGEGLAPEGEKSPVVKTEIHENSIYEHENQIESEEVIKDIIKKELDDSGNANTSYPESNEEVVDEKNQEDANVKTPLAESIKESVDEKNQEEDANVKASLPESINKSVEEINQEDQEVANVNTTLPESNLESAVEKNQEDQNGDQNNSENQQHHEDSVTGDDVRSNCSAGESSHHGRPSTLTSGSRGYERDQMNRATKLEEFPRPERYFGKERWANTVSVLQKIGFVNWEINTMLDALDKVVERREIEEENCKKAAANRKRKQITPAPPVETVKVPRVFIEKLAAIKRKDPNVESGILSPVLKPTEPTAVAPKQQKRQDITYLDLRACIGDASHPKFHILGENERYLHNELENFIRKEVINKTYEVLLGIVNSFFVNHTLMVECKTEKTLEVLKTRLSELHSELWPGVELTLLPRKGTRQKVEIFIPYRDIETEKILKIIKNQNQLATESWKVIERKDLDDGISLSVEVDEVTQLRVLNDQDDVFFLLARATIKVLAEDSLVPRKTGELVVGGRNDLGIPGHLIQAETMEKLNTYYFSYFRVSDHHNRIIFD